MRVIEITLVEYNDLLYAKEVLDRLYAAGVDNWEGYSGSHGYLTET